MNLTIAMKDIFEPSEDIVAREIEGEIIIIPLVSGIGDAEDNLYTLNASGRDVWQLMNGKNTVEDAVNILVDRYNASTAIIEKDVKGLLMEFCKRRFMIKKTSVK